MRPGGPGNHYCVVDQLSFGFPAVLTIEALDATGGIDQLLFAGKEGMTVGTDLQPNLRLRRPGLPRFTAGAVHR